MGYRADKGYEEAEKEAYHNWKASLTWPEYTAWLWRLWWPLVIGMTGGTAVYLLYLS